MVQDISAQQAWDILINDPDAHLVDCRTDAEWQYVGIPDLRRAGKQAVLVSWQYFPSGNVNPSFVEELRDAGVEPQHKVFFLCRSGVRSMAAAQAAAADGYAQVYNLEQGFEGPHDAEGHRGTIAGWKAEGLPWRQ